MDIKRCTLKRDHSPHKWWGRRKPCKQFKCEGNRPGYWGSK